MQLPNLSQDQLHEIMVLSQLDVAAGKDPKQNPRIQSIMRQNSSTFSATDPSMGKPDPEQNAGASLNASLGQRILAPTDEQGARLQALKNAAQTGSVGNPSQGQMQQGISNAMQAPTAKPQLSQDQQDAITQLLQNRGAAPSPDDNTDAEGNHPTQDTQDHLDAMAAIRQKLLQERAQSGQ